jgi:hypothetical protein
MLHLPNDMSKIVASHLRGAIVFRRESQQAATEYAAQQRPENDIQRTSIILSRTPRSDQHGDDCDDAARDLQQSRLVAGEAEAFDENRLEASDCSVGD